jgi:hypothetical protein
MGVISTNVHITGGYHIVELFQWKSTVESLVSVPGRGDTATQFYAAHQPILLFYVDFKGLNFREYPFKIWSYIYIKVGHANQDFYHFKPGLQHLSSRGKEFMCQLTQSAISSNPSSSLIKASTKEHPQPINDPIGELITKGKSQTTYYNLFLK